MLQKRRAKRNASTSRDACPKVSTYDRVKQFPRETIIAEKGQLFCEACGRKPLSKKKCIIANHCRGRAHIANLAKFEMLKKDKQVKIHQYSSIF